MAIAFIGILLWRGGQNLSVAIVFCAASSRSILHRYEVFVEYKAARSACRKTISSLFRQVILCLLSRWPYHRIAFYPERTKPSKIRNARRCIEGAGQNVLD